MRPVRKAAIAALWVVTVLEALMMGIAGWSKFGAGSAWWATQFEAWGYPEGTSYVIGAAEMGLALTLLVPRLASYAATGLIVIMLGALTTVLMNPGRLGPIPPALHLVALSIILRARWGVRWRPDADTAATSA